jgi:hypothetical protein
MVDPKEAPNYIVSDACISLTETLITCRASVVSLDEANGIGRDLYSWFQSQNAITDERAVYAKRSVELGIRAIQGNGTETVEDAVDLIKETYVHYVG